MVIKKRVEEIMAKRGMRPKDLVNKTGIPYTTLWRLVTGKIRMDVVRGGQIAAALGTSLDYLAGVTDDISPTVPGTASVEPVAGELDNDIVYIASEIYRMARRRGKFLSPREREDAAVLLRMASTCLCDADECRDEGTDYDMMS